MKRRQLIKYTGVAATSFAVAACGNNITDRDSQINQEPEAIFGKLEKTYLNLGILPRIEASPLIIAQEKGFFSRYGLRVSLSKQIDWLEMEQALLKGDLDAAQGLLAMPLMAQIEDREATLVSLMVLNLNGSAITLSPKAWQAKIRTAKDYSNFFEFANSYRQYIRKFEEPPQFAIESPASMDNYISRYWLSAMGLEPGKDIELETFLTSEMLYKMQAGLIEGYCVGEPWNQEAVKAKAGFVAYVSRDVWQGYPGQILATTQPWIDENPNSTRAMMAAVLEACQFCDQPQNRQEIAQILSRSRYLNLDENAIATALGGTYQYSSLGEEIRQEEISDLSLFYFRDTDYLQKPNHANYPWRSYVVWLLTQMVRWNQMEQFTYPEDADVIIDRVYPQVIYEDVAQALGIELPSESMKVEPANVFIDQRKFDPSEPVAYINSFTIRANRPQIFALS